MSASQQDYEKWIWTELVGFDNTSEDLGVGSYLNALGFQPEAICLFVSSPDFILLHPNVGENGVLPIDCCVYAAHSFSEDRKRQDWTQEQVKDLITQLHRFDVGVYVSAMTWFTHNRFHKEWLDTHREMIAWENVGPEPSNNMNPLKRLKDGTYFEDFFLKQLLDVIHYYGFDGWHAADGWGPAMNNIYDADFSDDMVEQFTQPRGIILPESIAGPCAGPDHDDRAVTKARADWIWRNLRTQWIEFYVDRWCSFYKKITSALHQEQKTIMVNSALTRDPFEAIYRFGIDYKKLVEAGVDGFVVESGAAAQDLVSGDRSRHYDYTATFMLIKAYVPDTKLIFLHVVQDHCENFDGLRHMPTAIEKEVYSLSNLQYYDSAGNLKRCADGLLACLGDSLLPEEWKWLYSTWETGFSGDAKGVDGPVLVWSDDALRKQLDDFIATRRWHAHKIVFNLMEKGASVQSVANVKSLGNVSGPLLLINADTFTKEEIEQIFGLPNRPIIVIGPKSDSLPEPDFQFEDIVQSYPLSCCVYGAKELPDINIFGNLEDELKTDPMDIVEAHFFVNELEARTVSNDFLIACSSVISLATSSLKVIEGSEYIKALVLEQKNGAHRLLLKSDSYSYCKAAIDMGRQIKSAKAVTSFPYAPVQFEGSELRNVTVPNKGAVIIDVKMAD